MVFIFCTNAYSFSHNHGLRENGVIFHWDFLSFIGGYSFSHNHASMGNGGTFARQLILEGTFFLLNHDYGRKGTLVQDGPL